MSGDSAAARSPLFTDTLQIGIVVHDLYAAMDTYVREYGIGPWEVYEMNSETVSEMEKDEVPAPHAMRLGLTMVGKVQWELIEPIGEGSIYAEFLRDHGEGIHHIGVAVDSYGDTVEEIHRKGNVILVGEPAGGPLRLPLDRPRSEVPDRDLRFPRKPVVDADVGLPGLSVGPSAA